MKKLFSLAILALSCVKVAHAQPAPLSVAVTPSVMVSSAGNVGNAPIVVLLSTPTGGGAYTTGYSHYITHIHLEAFATGGTATQASINQTPIQCTSVNIPSSPVWNFAVPITTGTIQVTDIPFDNPTQSVNVSSNTTISCPATANVRWNAQVNYFVAP